MQSTKHPNHPIMRERRNTHLLFARAREFDAMLCDQLLDALLMKVDLCAPLAVLRGHAYFRANARCHSIIRT